MGLDTTHGCWHGSYGGFSQWRNALAVAEGIPLVKNSWGGDTYFLDHDKYKRENYEGEWDETPADPLLILLVHSDCDGIIRWEHAGILADRLEQVIPKLPEIPAIVYGHYPPDHRGYAEQFVAGLRAAHHAQEDVEFG